MLPGASIALGAGAGAAGASPLLSLLSTAAGVAIPMLQGRQAQLNAQHAAAINELNAGIARRNAANESQRTQAAAQDQAIANAAQLGRQRVAQGGTGFKLSSRTSRKVAKASRNIARKELQRIGDAGHANITNHLRQADNFDTQADAQRQEGDAAQKAGLIRGFSTLLGGARFNPLKRKSTIIPIPRRRSL